MKKFVSGILAGTALTVGTAAAALFTVKKKVIEPIEEKEATIEDNRRKAMRKSRAR